jgi:hypothetical protein
MNQRQGFWETLFTPQLGGNPYALALLLVAGACMFWRYRKLGNLEIAAFWAFCFGANLVKFLAAVKGVGR